MGAGARTIAVLAVCVLLCFQCDANGWPTVQPLVTQHGVKYGIVTAHQVSKAPTLITLTGAMADTLGCNATGTNDPCYYANACEFLVPAGWVCASLDLPSHGGELEPGEPEGIAGWRWRVDRGQNFVAQNNQRVRQMLDDLVRRNISDPSRVAISGISRGGFMSAHYSLFDTRVKAIGMLSPVTQLSLLTEFDGDDNSTLTASLSLLNKSYTDRLIEKNIWAIIGDQDTRVYTDSLVRTMRQVECTGCSPGPHRDWGCTDCPARTSETRFTVQYEPQGHTVPPSSEGGRPTFRLLASWFIAKMSSE